MRVAFIVSLCLSLVAICHSEDLPIKKGGTPALLARRDLKAEAESYTLKGLTLTDFKPDDIRTFHAGHVVSFLDTANNFGVSRLPVMANYPRSLPTWSSDEASKRTFYLIEHDLIGTVMHSKPVAYQRAAVLSAFSNKITHTASTAPVRDLDEFERSALEKFANGQDLVSQENPGQLRIVGAIRATKDCLGCHDCKENTLLGAFTFHLVDQDAYRAEMDRRNVERIRVMSTSRNIALETQVQFPSPVPDDPKSRMGKFVGDSKEKH